MAWSDEVVAFVKGTRPRPPPGPKSMPAFLLFVAATACHLPLVYLLVRHDAFSPPAALTVGLLAMGLAWSGGCSLEGRRPRTVRAIAALGVAEGALAFAPPFAAPLGEARWLFLAIAAFAAAGLASALRAR